ncbi:MAG: Clp1/GlmU family protein [Bacillota bacterium]
MLEEPDQWRPFIDEVLPQARLLILVGAVDTGKTTLTTCLANRSLALGYKTAVVDADVGQSDIGPPTTVGLGLLRETVGSLQNIPLTDFYFVGSTTPRGHVAAALTGTKKMVERAFAAGAERVVINTTGLVGGSLGRTLKYHKVSLTRPDCIIGLQRHGEIEPLLKTWEAYGFTVYRLPVPAGVRQRSLEMRVAFRNRRWREFFGGAVRLRLPFGSFRTARTSMFTGGALSETEKHKLESLLGQPLLWVEKMANEVTAVTLHPVPQEVLAAGAGLLAVPRLRRIAPESFEGMVAGLVGPEGQCLSLGWVEKVDYEAGNLLVMTPYRGYEPVRVVEFSGVRLDGESIFEKGMKSEAEPA